jgi:TPR repeat protein
MSWFFKRGSRAEAKALEERIAALRAELAMCQQMAGHRRHMRRVGAGALALVILAVGFVLGLYSEPITQRAVELAQQMGLMKRPQTIDVAYSQYQKGDYAAALELLVPLAEQGNRRAQSTLGLMYYHGRGVRRDDVEAVKWFRLAAERGYARAQFDLANMYSEGMGVPQDYAQALKLFQRAAAQNYAQAQYNLGLWYAKGEGVEQDYVRAHMWFNLAASTFPASEGSGRLAALNNRELIAGKMSRDQLAEAQRLAREWKPSS